MAGASEVRGQKIATSTSELLNDLNQTQIQLAVCERDSAEAVAAGIPPSVVRRSVFLYPLHNKTGAQVNHCERNELLRRYAALA